MLNRLPEKKMLLWKITDMTIQCHQYNREINKAVKIYKAKKLTKLLICPKRYSKCVVF